MQRLSNATQYVKVILQVAIIYQKNNSATFVTICQSLAVVKHKHEEKYS